MVTVFFELNGQPRRVKVPDRAHGASAAKARRKAEAGNEAHVGAPMPGVVSTLAVAAGQAVKAGDVLLSIEAMKMETALHAERDGTVAEVLVKAGDQIDAKDLLVVFGVTAIPGRLSASGGSPSCRVDNGLTRRPRSGIEPLKLRRLLRVATQTDSEKNMADDITETSQTVAAGQLRAFIERIERLEEEKKTISDDIKEVFAEAKGTGFDTKAMRTIIRLRKKDQAERQEEDAILDLYMAALGMV